MNEVWRLVVLEVDVEGQLAQVRRLDGEPRWAPLKELPEGVRTGDIVRMTQTASGQRGEIEWIGQAHGS